MKFYFLLILFIVFSISPEIFYGNVVTFSLILFLLVLLEFIRGFGSRIHPLDLMALYAVLVYLLAPSLSYYLTEIEWYEGVNSMVVDREKYFSVAIPGTLALLAGLNFPFRKVHQTHNDYYEKIKDYLSDKTDAGIKLFWIGLASNFVTPFVPGGLGFFMQLASQLIYIGGLYIWFSPKLEMKWPYILAMFLLPAARALREGMFGEVIFWGVFLLMVMLLRYRVALYKKLILAASGIIMMLFIQSIKYEYRQLTWFTSSAGEASLSSQASVFQDLVQDRLDHPDMLYGPYMLSNALDRTNQGSLVAMTIRYVPEYEPFANGETIFLATAASFIPRFIWPDKPQVGGREKMIRFTGFDNGQYTAMDIGQLGDAYVNFGVWGGALFMFVYGLIFCFILARLFDISDSSMLSLILWIPLFYTGVIKMEGSVLETFNHIIKSGMFAFIVIWGYEKIFGSKL